MLLLNLLNESIESLKADPNIEWSEIKSDMSDELHEGQCVGSWVCTSVDARLVHELFWLLEERDMDNEEVDEFFEDADDEEEHEDERLSSRLLSLGERGRECHPDL